MSLVKCFLGDFLGVLAFSEEPLELFALNEPIAPCRPFHFCWVNEIKAARGKVESSVEMKRFTGDENTRRLCAMGCRRNWLTGAPDNGKTSTAVKETPD